MHIEPGGFELVDHLAPLWEALFDHHASVGAAGLATIPRGESWPLRRAHYERIFAAHDWARVWLVRNDAGAPIGYALAFETRLDQRPAVVLESLSLLPAARGTGLGSELIGIVFAQSRDRGAELGVIDVMGGNHRARELYRRHGFAPWSESWMRSQPQPQPQLQPQPAQDPHASVSADMKVDSGDADLVGAAHAAGFDLEFLPGPDDSWVSSSRLAGLTPREAGTVADSRTLATLFATLEAAGLWTILVDIPTAPRAEALRAILGESGFRLSMERVVRDLGSPGSRR